MSANPCGCSIVSRLCIGSHGKAYEQATHAVFTTNLHFSNPTSATARPIFSAPWLYPLGVDSFATLGVAKGYFEFIGNITGVSAYPRTAQDSRNQDHRPLRAQGRQTSIQIGLIFGAIREDDNPSEDPPTPQDVETGISRPLHHFFDPYSNKPLNAPGLDAIENDVRKNVDWAIGVHDSFNDPNTPESPRRNRFTVFDARESMFRALTLMTSSGGSSYSDISGGIGATTKQQCAKRTGRLRSALSATCFT